MRASTRISALLLLSAVAACHGCVPSEHALTDEKTSTIDEDLIGEWFNATPTPFPMPESANSSIRKKAGSETVLELVEAGQDPVPLYCTTIAGNRYFCAGDGDEPDSKLYWIVRYEFCGRDEIRFRFLSSDAVFDAIHNGQLAGAASYFFGTKQASLTETSEGLRAYLEKHGKECFDRDAVVLLKRVKD